MSSPRAAGRLLALLHERGPLTRTAVTTELGLARSAVGTALEELTGLGLVRLSGPVPQPGRGRPSPLVELDDSGPAVIAVQLLPDQVKVAVVGLGRRVHALSAHPLGPARDPESVVRLVGDLIARTSGAMDRPCTGVCVAMSGFVGDGFVHSSLHLGWRSVPLADLLTERLPGLPIVIGRASSLAALAEYRYGAGRGAVGMLALNCEHLGVGGGFVTGGALLTGTGFGLEAGHTIVDPGGLPCACGARGCLEMYADGRSLLRTRGLSEDQALSGADRVPSVLRSRAAADVRAVRTTARHLAVGLTSLVNTLSPERVVLTGFLAGLYRVSGELIRHELAGASIVARAGQVTIHTGVLPYAVLLGAADQALTPLLGDPRTAGSLSRRRRALSAGQG